MSNSKDIISKIQSGEIDINNQELFFSILLKGILSKLDDDICIRDIKIPHIILHTGDDTLYIKLKKYNASKEPKDISNENYIYNIIPRCIVEPGGVDADVSQFTSPYSHGILQFEDKDNLYTMSGDFRRMPLTMGVTLKYYIDSYKDMLSLLQQIYTKLAIVQNFYIVYMGQRIQCSYAIPSSLSGEYTTDLDGSTTDNKYKIINMELSVQTSLPIYNPKSLISTSNIIENFGGNIIVPSEKTKINTR